jgi:hypothetical protein
MEYQLRAYKYLDGNKEWRRVMIQNYEFEYQFFRIILLLIFICYDFTYHQSKFSTDMRCIFMTLVCQKGA